MMVDALHMVTAAAPVTAPPAAPSAEPGFAVLLTAALPALVAPGATPPVSTPASDAAGTSLPVSAAIAVSAVPTVLPLPAVWPDIASAQAEAPDPDIEAPIAAWPGAGSSGGMVGETGIPPRWPALAAMLQCVLPTAMGKPVARPVLAAKAEDALPPGQLIGVIPFFDALPVPIAFAVPMATDVGAVAVKAASCDPAVSPMSRTRGESSLVPLAFAGKTGAQSPISDAVKLAAAPVPAFPAPIVPKPTVLLVLDAAPPLALDAAPPLALYAAPKLAADVAAPLAATAAPLPSLPASITPQQAGAGPPAPFATSPSLAMTTATPARRELRVRPGLELSAAVAPPISPAMAATAPDRAGAPTPETPGRPAEPASAPTATATVATNTLGDVRIGLDGGPNDLRVSLGLSSGGAAIVVADAARLVGDLAANGIRLQSLDVGSGGANSGDARPRSAPALPVIARAFAADTPDRSPAAADRYA